MKKIIFILLFIFLISCKNEYPKEIYDTYYLYGNNDVYFKLLDDNTFEYNYSETIKGEFKYNNDEVTLTSNDIEIVISLKDEIKIKKSNINLHLQTNHQFINEVTNDEINEIINALDYDIVSITNSDNTLNASNKSIIYQITDEIKKCKFTNKANEVNGDYIMINKKDSNNIKLIVTDKIYLSYKDKTYVSKKYISLDKYLKNYTKDYIDGNGLQNKVEELDENIQIQIAINKIEKYNAIEKDKKYSVSIKKLLGSIKNHYIILIDDEIKYESIDGVDFNYDNYKIYLVNENDLSIYNLDDAYENIITRDELLQIKEMLSDYQSPKYTVTFDINGGKLLKGDLVQTVSNAAQLVLPVVTKAGYKFKSYEPDINSLFINKDITIKLIWDEVINDYKVTIEGIDEKIQINYIYEGNVVKTQEVDENNPLPYYEHKIDGYAFNGLYLDKEFTKSFDYNYKLTKSMNLYIKMTKMVDDFIDCKSINIFEIDKNNPCLLNLNNYNEDKKSYLYVHIPRNDVYNLVFEKNDGSNVDYTFVKIYSADHNMAMYTDISKYGDLLTYKGNIKFKAEANSLVYFEFYNYKPATKQLKIYFDSFDNTQIQSTVLESEYTLAPNSNLTLVNAYGENNKVVYKLNDEIIYNIESIKEDITIDIAYQEIETLDIVYYNVETISDYKFMSFKTNEKVYITDNKLCIQANAPLDLLSIDKSSYQINYDDIIMKEDEDSYEYFKSLQYCLKATSDNKYYSYFIFEYNNQLYMITSTYSSNVYNIHNVSKLNAIAS